MRKEEESTEKGESCVWAGCEENDILKNYGNVFLERRSSGRRFRGDTCKATEAQVYLNDDKEIQNSYFHRAILWTRHGDNHFGPLFHLSITTQLPHFISKKKMSLQDVNL